MTSLAAPLSNAIAAQRASRDVPDSALPTLVRGAGAPLVLIPGLDGGTGEPMGISRLISEVEVFQLAKGARVLRMGRDTGVTPGISVAGLAARYAAELAAVFAEPVDVVGVSTGGSIALQLAADYPHLVRRLVLVSAAHRLSGRGRDIQRDAARRLALGQKRRASALLLSNVGVSLPARSLLAAVGWLFPRLVLGHHVRDLRVLLEAEDEFDLTGRLSSLRTPTLVIAGSRDRFYSRELYEELALALPHASLNLQSRGHLSLHGNGPLAHRVLAFVMHTEVNPV